MDYIQQAIDKARSQRQQDGAMPPVQPPRTESRPGTPAKIAYTQTRTIVPAPAQLARQRVIAGFPEDKRAESYRQLRTQVLHKFRENNWRTLAVTSPNPQAGKTLTALNLAISLSLEVNQTVLLVDLDLRHPSILEKLGIDAEFGLVDYL
jgi:Mrp family chromosome partitioning ATPase